jgi:hypothetical protein
VPEFVEPILRIVRGSTVGLTDILKLDDFAIWVLIDSISQSSIKDETVRDLADRIRARDLFKKVPITTEQYHLFNMNEGIRDQLYEVIKPYCRGDSKYYLVKDEVHFEMLSKNENKKACLVNSYGEIEYCDDHLSFEIYKHQNIREVRLYTIREAIEPVAKFILQNQ